jgi:hypothetical protein
VQRTDSQPGGASRLQALHVGTAKLWLLFGTEVIVFALVRLPLDLSFAAYAFADRGSFLTACYLVAHGGRPAIDFGYPYGLLAALLGATWFHLFGLTPIASESAAVLCALAIAWAFARLARAMRLGLVGVIFLAAALPFAILGCYLSLVYAFEAAVLSNALAEQAARRRSSALALVTAACLIKPSMGYPYGLILLLFMIVNSGRSEARPLRSFDLRAFAVALVPVAATGLILVSILGAVFGLRPLLATLLPTSGRAFYRFFGYGSVFHGGRGLLYQPGKIPEYYLSTVAGFWIIGTIWLVVAGARAAWRTTRSLLERRVVGVGEEFVLTCAALHLAFISLFFGGEGSWEYYAYVLVMGAAATSVWGAMEARALASIAALALAGQTAHIAKAVQAWRTTSPSRQTGGLWASTEERQAWQQVLAVTAQRKAAVVTFQGGTAVLFPQFEPPLGAYLVPAESLSSEIAGTEQRLREAPAIFAVTSGDYSAALAFFPQFRRMLQERTAILEEPLEGLTFTVYGSPSHRASGAPIRAP